MKKLIEHARQVFCLYALPEIADRHDQRLAYELEEVLGRLFPFVGDSVKQVFKG